MRKYNSPHGSSNRRAVTREKSSTKAWTIAFKTHCGLGFLLRLILVAYANYHDRYFNVPYTDVDYKVFTDAARLITKGESPFDRHTYRYTPLLAFILTPNVYLHQDFGKILFSVIDILVAILIQQIVLGQKYKQRTANLCALLWLYNPLTIVISTRGNADSLAVLFVLQTLYLLLKDHCLTAGLIHGLSIHFRLYPLAFSLAMYLSLREKNWFLPNRKQLKLVLACALSLFDLTVISYHLYGYKFLYESFIYHLIRKDARHNFSAYFYMLYLSANKEPGILQRILTFLPQLTILVALSFCYSSKQKLPFALFTQAMIMVTYNPVMTSQYFFWFLSLLPLCLPNLKMSLTRASILIGSWILSQSLWLIAAYLLEFKGNNSFLYIWLASLLFFAVNIKVLTAAIHSYRPPTIDESMAVMKK